MSRNLLLFTAGLLALGSISPSNPAAQDKPAYLAPYGLRKADLGNALAKNFLAVVLGEGTAAEQEAALALFAAGQYLGGSELQEVANHFQVRGRGVQAVVWRDTSTGKLKRAGADVPFNPDTDRVELVFIKFDLKAIPQETAQAPNPPTADSQAWVEKVVKSAQQNPRDYYAGQALFGNVGGSGDFRAGNIVPVHQKVRKQLEARARFFHGMVTSVETTPTMVAVVAFQYPDGRSRIPVKMRYTWAIEKSGFGGKMVDNK